MGIVCSVFVRMGSDSLSFLSLFNFAQTMEIVFATNFSFTTVDNSTFWDNLTIPPVAPGANARSNAAGWSAWSSLQADSQWRAHNGDFLAVGGSVPTTLAVGTSNGEPGNSSLVFVASPAYNMSDCPGAMCALPKLGNHEVSGWFESSAWLTGWNLLGRVGEEGSADMTCAASANRGYDGGTWPSEYSNECGICRHASVCGTGGGVMSGGAAVSYEHHVEALDEGW